MVLGTGGVRSHAGVAISRELGDGIQDPLAMLMPAMKIGIHRRAGLLDTVVHILRRVGHTVIQVVLTILIPGQHTRGTLVR